MAKTKPEKEKRPSKKKKKSIDLVKLSLMFKEHSENGKSYILCAFNKAIIFSKGENHTVTKFKSEQISKRQDDEDCVLKILEGALNKLPKGTQIQIDTDSETIQKFLNQHRHFSNDYERRIANMRNRFSITGMWHKAAKGAERNEDVFEVLERTLRIGANNLLVRYSQDDYRGSPKCIA